MRSETANYRPSAKFAGLAPKLRSISQATCRSQLHLAVAEAVLSVGCDHYVFASAVARTEDTAFEPTLSSLPERVVRELLDSGAYRSNPVLSTLRTTQSPVTIILSERHPNPRIAEISRIVASERILGAALVPVLSATDHMSILGVYSISGVPGSSIIECATLIGAATSLRLLELHDQVEPPRLTGTQATILKWAAAGKSTGDIATIIGLTARNCEYHLGQIYKKLGVSSRGQAIAALAEGRVQIPMSTAALEK